MHNAIAFQNKVWDLDFLAIDKIYLAILFLVPGFVCMKVYATCVAAPPLDASKSAIEALSLSSVIYAIFSPVLWLAHRYSFPEAYPIAYAALWLTVLLAAPVALAVAWAHLRKTRWCLELFPHPIGKAWDYIFGQREQLYIIVTFRSGKRIAGAYGARSFASSGHHDEQIYLEEVWDIDEEEGFERRHERTRGMLISHSQIESLEFIGLYDD